MNQQKQDTDPTPEEEARLRNEGINPHMPSNIQDANGSRWAHIGPFHDTKEKKVK